MAGLVGPLTRRIASWTFRSATSAAWRSRNSTRPSCWRTPRKQAAERGYKNFPIVDVDSHHYEIESFGEILEYMDDPVLQQLAQSASQTGMRQGAGLVPSGVGYQDMGGRVTRYALRGIEKTAAGDPQRDITLTKRWMDAIGIDIAVLFPTPMLHARPASAGRGRGGAGARL